MTHYYSVHLRAGLGPDYTLPEPFSVSAWNEHPPVAGSGGFGASSWGSKTDLPYNAANISQDLNPKGDKPIWPLSSYAPFKNETTLIGGLDVSPEEMRVKAVAAVNAGNVNEYIQYEASQTAAAEQVFNTARTNANQTFEQAVKQSRLTTTGASSSSTFPSTSPAFNNTAGTSAFGNATFGQTGFNQPAFGQSGFGQTSSLGPTSTSVFGQPSGQPSSSQAATSTTTSAFGQPTFGQTNPLAGASGSPSLVRPASGAFSAFAGSGPTVFGAGTAPNSNPSDSTGGGFSAFAGQTSAFGNTGAGNTSSIFGQTPSQAAGTTSVFGAPSTFGQQSGNAFSALTSSSTNAGSVFGSFGTPAPATQATTTTPTVQPVSAFGVPSQQSVFGNLNTNSPQQQPVSAFGQPTSNLTVSPSGLVPSISMASSNSGGSAFPASPMSAVNNPPADVPKQPSKSSSSSSKTIDFASLISRTTYRPGSTPYDSQLPQNYSTMLPERVNNAFGKEKFTWAWKDAEGAVPDWVPPVDVR